jgi:hypothetical protein
MMFFENAMSLFKLELPRRPTDLSAFFSRL